MVLIDRKMPHIMLSTLRSGLIRCLGHNHFAANYATAPASKKQSPTQKQALIQLRKDTGYPLAKCKQALLKANYDVKKALEELHANAEKENWDKMKNLSSRKASQGLVTAYRVGNRAVMLEINCETDFVAKTSDFQSFVGLVAKSTLKHYASFNDDRIDLTRSDILKLPAVSKDSTLEDALVKVIGKVKENVNIPRGVVTSVNASNDEFIGIYTHPDLGTPNTGGKLPLMGRYAAVVGMNTTAGERQGPGWLLSKARDMAQHIIGMNPTTIGTRDGDKQSAPSAQSETANQPLSGSGEAGLSDEETDGEEMLGNQQACFDSDELLKQAFLLDANITVQNWLDINRLDVRYFIRYELGGHPADEVR